MKNETINGTWISGSAAMIFAGIELLLFLFVPGVREWFQKFSNENMVFYAVFLMTFAIVFLGANCFLYKREFSINISLPVQWGLLLLGLAAGIGFLMKMIMNEGRVLGVLITDFVWHRIPYILSFLTVLGIAFVLLWCWRQDEKKEKGHIFYVIDVIIAAASGFSLYIPNYLAADPLHGHAYYSSIYDVAHGTPYDDLFTSIYGHYAIFLRWPVKTIGNGNIKDAALLMALLGGLATFLALWALHQNIRDNKVRILAALSIGFPVIGTRLNNYWQVQPHRVLFTCIFLFYGAVYNKYKFKGAKIFGYVLATLAIVWNTETGLVCAAAWVAFLCYEYTNEKDFFRGKTLLFLLIQVLAAVAAFFGAVVFVGIYNLIHGGSWNSLSTFLYPLLTKEYMDGFLRIDLPNFISAYMLVLALFLMGMVWSLAHHRIFRREQAVKREADRAFVFLASVLGLGQITYFMNRAVYYNLDLIHVVVVVLLCIFLDHNIFAWKEFRKNGFQGVGMKNGFRGVMVVWMTVILVGTSLGTIMQGGYHICLRGEREYQDLSKVYELLDEIKKDVPINTFGFGQGVPELYGLMEWDTRCHVIDFSDRTEQQLQYVRERLENEDSFFAYIQDAEFILEEQQGIWHRYKSYEYAGDEYGAFLRVSY